MRTIVKSDYIGTTEVSRMLGCTPPTARNHMMRCGGTVSGYLCPCCGHRSPSLLVKRESFMVYMEGLEKGRGGHAE